MGELAALGTALLWATSSTMAGSQTRRLPATVIGAVQLLAATVLIWSVTAALLATGAIEGTTLARTLALAATAVLGPGIGDTLYFVAIRLLGVARAFPVAMAASPLFTIALAAAFVGEAITLGVLLGAALTIAGILLIAVRAETIEKVERRPRAGLWLVLLAALLWAVSAVLLRLTADGIAAPLVSAVRMPTAAVFVLALALGTGRLRPAGGYSRRSLGILVLAGLLGVGIGSVLYVVAIQEAGAARTAILSSTAPLFALPLAAFSLGERITSRIAAGAVLTVAGIWLITV